MKEGEKSELYIGILGDNEKIRDFWKLSDTPSIGCDVFVTGGILKLPSNNWRKLHNLPMKRRGYHGRRKRNNF